MPTQLIPLPLNRAEILPRRNRRVFARKNYGKVKLGREDFRAFEVVEGGVKSLRR